MDKIKELFNHSFDESQIRTNEPMKNHTSFKIGGPADIFFIPKTPEEIKKALSICKDNKIPHYILGNGTNILFSDKGFRGVVINIFENYNQVFLSEETLISAKSGILLSSLANFALENELCGFEFASGIPGTLGGAVCMNAGAYGGEMKDVIESVEVLDKEGNIKLVSNTDMNFSYRNSVIQQEGLVVLSASVRLQKGDKSEISSKMNELNTRRREKQPLEMPSAGSTFKRPEGHFAGKLIMDAGLQGYTLGGAMISEKHCGFIVNKGNATCADVMNLVAYVKNTVQDKFGVAIEPEIRIIGE